MIIFNRTIQVEKTTPLRHYIIRVEGRNVGIYIKVGNTWYFRPKKGVLWNAKVLESVASYLEHHLNV